MDGRGRAGEIVDFVHFHKQGKGHIVPEQLKTLVVHQVIDVFARAAEEVVDAQHLVPLRQQAFTKMGAQKAGPSRYQNPFAQVHSVVLSLLPRTRGVEGFAATPRLLARGAFLEDDAPFYHGRNTIATEQAFGPLRNGAGKIVAIGLNCGYPCARGSTAPDYRAFLEDGMRPACSRRDAGSAAQP